MSALDDRLNAPPVFTPNLRANEAVVDGWIVDSITGEKKYPVEMTLAAETAAANTPLELSRPDQGNNPIGVLMETNQGPLVLLILAAGILFFLFRPRK